MGHDTVLTENLPWCKFCIGKKTFNKEGPHWLLEPDAGCISPGVQDPDIRETYLVDRTPPKAPEAINRVVEGQGDVRGL
jgi:hypothetical protein